MELNEIIAGLIGLDVEKARKELSESVKASPLTAKSAIAALQVAVSLFPDGESYRDALKKPLTDEEVRAQLPGLPPDGDVSLGRNLLNGNGPTGKWDYDGPSIVTIHAGAGRVGRPTGSTNGSGNGSNKNRDVKEGRRLWQSHTDEDKKAAVAKMLEGATITGHNIVFSQSKASRVLHAAGIAYGAESPATVLRRILNFAKGLGIVGELTVSFTAEE